MAIKKCGTGLIIGVLIGNSEKLFCLLLSMTIQDGDKQIGQWINPKDEVESHVVIIIRDAAQIASALKPSILLPDRYFLTVPVLMAWSDEEKRVGKSILGFMLSRVKCPSD